MATSVDSQGPATKKQKGHQQKEVSLPFYKEPESNQSSKAYALAEMGLSEVKIKKFTKKMDPKGFAAIVNFKLGCLYIKLPVQWGQPQVRAFLIYVHVEFYSMAYLIRMWNTQ